MIIAECGQNFVGDMDLAQKLIVLAKENGADLVKFQLYDSKKLYGEYQTTELTEEQAQWLFNVGESVGIEVFFSVFDTKRIKWCEEIGVKRYKVAFSQNQNLSLIKALTKTDKPVIISENEHQPATIGYLEEYQILYCIPSYPTGLKELNLAYIDEYDGLSDHTIGLEASMIAISRGATIIEKHFALNHETGVDAKWSMTPSELRELANFYSKVQEAL